MNAVSIYQSFSTNKIKESFTFYADVLGLTATLKGDKFIHVFLPYEQKLVIYQKDTHLPANYTILNFQVSDIQHAVTKLAAKGVCFIQYPAPFETDEQGISWDDQGSHLAWFNDPGGNILALIEN